MIKYRKILALVFALIITMSSINITFAEEPVEISAQAAVLIDQNTGRVLYEKNPHEKIYPASMTKILTAIVAMEYLDPNEMLVVGNEINTVPYDSSKAGVEVGETIRVDNLMSLMLIPSGNEVACVVAKAAAQKATNNPDLQYNEAEIIFADLMNKKAKELGANNSNFVNPDGYHDPNHYSTVYDIALISKELMKDELLRTIVGEEEFVGNGAGEGHSPSLKTNEYDLLNRNLLITDNQYSYPYATGIKTGHTDEAGYCLSASASKDGVDLIVCMANGTEPERWVEATSLFEYGFKTYSNQPVQTKDKKVGEAALDNNKQGESATLELMGENEFSLLLSEKELSAITTEITYDPALVVPGKDGVAPYQEILAPVTKGQTIGEITYYLDGEVIFTDKVVAARDVEERSFISDVGYYFNEFTEVAFTMKAIPFWIGGILFVILLIFIIRKLIKRRNRNHYTFRRRY